MPTLPVRTLGRTGIEVTILGYGAMELRGGERGRSLTDDEVGAILNGVLDAGINFIDTSPDYGLSEERIGEHISHRRDEFFLASKCGCLVAVEPTDGGPRHVFTADNVEAAVHQSLRRMRTDHLDLVQFHGSPSIEELEEHGAIEVLQRLQQDGLVRFIGSSSTLPNIDALIERQAFDAFQIPYSALQREHEDVIARAAAAGAGTVIRGGAARGAPSEDKAWSARIIGAGGQEPRAIWEAAALDDLLDGMTRQAFTTRFTLSHPDLDTTIIGTANLEHLAENVAALHQGALPDDVYEEAKRRLAAAGSAPAAPPAAE